MKSITPLPGHLEALRSIQLGDYTLLDYREAAYEGYRLNDWWQDKPHTVLHAATEAAGHEIVALTARVKELEEALTLISNRPSEMKWGDDDEVREALREMEAIADVALNPALKEPTT
jgi:hypothetical protein